MQRCGRCYNALPAAGVGGLQRTRRRQTLNFSAAPGRLRRAQRCTGESTVAIHEISCSRLSCPFRASQRSNFQHKPAEEAQNGAVFVAAPTSALLPHHLSTSAADALTLQVHSKHVSVVHILCVPDICKMWCWWCTVVGVQQLISSPAHHPLPLRTCS